MIKTGSDEREKVGMEVVVLRANELQQSDVVSIQSDMCGGLMIFVIRYNESQWTEHVWC